MSDWDKLVRLKLRQAQRKERPYWLIKGIFVGAILLVLCALVGNCSPGVDTTAKLSQQQVRKNTEAIWGGHTEARKKRIP